MRRCWGGEGVGCGGELRVIDRGEDLVNGLLEERVYEGGDW